ncbi:helix-turn-helix transcriptional regulator [Sphingomonas turrisvirgatae]|uniref:helix-turn-helix transcriptional regulator n=1 Tax=Sphingomonas turrisvirgatae TaxID=1888892 RepID=UPI001300CFE4|nr:LuxR C-terminal-related transcriptional regulator [Sphingomonas turrisvirgatae]
MASADHRDRRPPVQGGFGGEMDALTGRLLGDLVSAIGTAAFPGCLLDALSFLADVELCSVFARHNGQRIELIFSHGELPARPGFAQQASLAYLRTYWQSDRQLAQLSRTLPGTPVVVRRRASDIADPAYRTACYDQAGVVGRVSILSPGRPCFIINGYRSAGRAPFSADDVTQLERCAPVLLAALRQHLWVTLTMDCPRDETTLAARLVALDYGLSMREAEVVAALMMDETQADIAAAKQLSVSTVVTYRRRAYQKLGVTSQRDLKVLRQRLVSGPGERDSTCN